MSVGAFYIVHINPASDVSSDDIKKAMDKALDWYQISDNTWLLFTTSKAEKLYARLKPSVKEEGRVFVSRLDITDRQGWMGKGFWAWLRKDRSAEA